jgi:hypothetical protein
MQRSAEEINEIERHKYFLSEKRGYDVGWQVAEEDWERQYGEAWRRAHAAVAPCCRDSHVETSCCADKPGIGNGRRETAVSLESDDRNRRFDAIRPAGQGGPLRWLLSRIFQHEP